MGFRINRSNNDEVSVDLMREDLAEQEAMNMNVGDIVDMLIYGVDTPLDEVPDIEIRDQWEELFGKDNPHI